MAHPWCSTPLLAYMIAPDLLLPPLTAEHQRAWAAMQATQSPAFKHYHQLMMAAPNSDLWLRPILEGKSVIIIGPAGYTQSGHNAIKPSEIASFDVVIRPNVKLREDGSLLIPPNTTERCDIVYHSGTWLGKKIAGPTGLVAATNRTALSNATLRSFMRNGVKGVLVTGSRNKEVQYFSCLTPPTGLSLGISRWPGWQNLTRIGRFRTGLRAVLDIVRFRPRKLRVLGFDFYQTSKRGFEGYYDEFEVATNRNPSQRGRPVENHAGQRVPLKGGVKRNRRRRDVARRFGDSSWHDSLDELRTFDQCVLRRFPFVEIDEHLRTVIQLKAHKPWKARTAGLSAPGAAFERSKEMPCDGLQL